MYRQVRVQAKQRNLQRIIWRPTRHAELNHYWLNTVTYGTTSASFLAIRSLHQAAVECETSFPKASKAIVTDFYVDNFLFGVRNIEKGRKIKREASEVLDKSYFVLREWIPNNKEILEESEREIQEIKHYVAEDSKIKTLGVLWHSHEDTLQYTVKFKARIQPIKCNIFALTVKILTR